MSNSCNQIYHSECRKKVISMNTQQKEVAEQKTAMTIRYGKTLYKVIFHFAEKSKATMNDKVLKLIRSNSLCEPTS